MLPAKGVITPEEIIELIGGRRLHAAHSLGFARGVCVVWLNRPFSAHQCQADACVSIAPDWHSKPWPMGEVQIESLVLKWLILSPFDGAAKTVLINFTAKAQLFPKVFKDLFEFNIAFDQSSKQLTIAASYTGVVVLLICSPAFRSEQQDQ